jgi:hypothetical protein
MVRRVCRELGTKKRIIVLNDEAHHCYRRKPDGEDVNQLGKEPRLAELLTRFFFGKEVGFERRLGGFEGDFVGAFGFQIIKRTNRGFADDGGVLGSGGHILAGQNEPGNLDECGVGTRREGRTWHRRPAA